MDKKLSKAERTRQYIIEKTAPVFNELGYAGTSIQALTEATGLTKGSIYGNFANKDEVALAAFDYNFGMVSAHIRGKMEEKSTHFDKLLVYVEVYRNYFRYPLLRGGCPILNTATEADDTHPALRQRAADAIKLWRGSVERHLLKAVEKGEIRLDMPPEEFSMLMVSLVEGGMMQAKVTGSSKPMQVTIDHLEKLLRSMKT